MPKDFQATARERAVGRKLASWRGQRGLSLAEAGNRVGFSSAKLSMMENAIQPSSSADIMALGYVYEVPITEWQFVMAQAQHAAALRSSPQSEAAVFDPTEDLPHLIADATRLRMFATDTVPAILQLAGYTAAIAQRDPSARSSQLSRVRETWATRTIDGDPPAVEAVLLETVLRQLVGGKRVLKAQLLHLMEVSELPPVSLRVIPHTAGAYPAMGCPFTWLSFPHRQHKDVVYTENLWHGDYAESHAAIARVTDRFSELQKLAATETDSLELIAAATALI